MFDFFMFVAVVVLFAMLTSTRGRLKRAEGILEEAAKRIGALQRQTGLLPPKPGETFVTPPPTPAAPRSAADIEEELRQRWGPKDSPKASGEAGPAPPAPELPAEPPKGVLRSAALAVPPPPAIAEDVPPEVPIAEPATVTDEPPPAAISAEPVAAEPVEPEPAQPASAPVERVMAPPPP
ncbi:MAG: hypothetical protein HC788_08425, partial [Sphingopyxis sp.]|nr:hypothetical protein [Sphingopyxis sp.]